AHRDHVRAALLHGELLLGGPLLDSANGDNVLLFQADTPATVENFAKADPYVLGGIVTHWQVSPWQTVVGKQADRKSTRLNSSHSLHDALPIWLIGTMCERRFCMASCCWADRCSIPPTATTCCCSKPTRPPPWRTSPRPTRMYSAASSPTGKSAPGKPSSANKQIGRAHV